MFYAKYSYLWKQMLKPVLISLLVLLAGCASPVEERVFPLEEMAEGDLAFRCGQGLFSRIVTTAESEGVYSHIGLLVRDEGDWKIAHAVPGEKEFKGDFDRVKLEDLYVFFSADRAMRGCLVHTGLVRESAKALELCRQAILSARDSVRFDNDYSLEDSSKVYCTEFVWRLFRRQGIDLAEGRCRQFNTLYLNGDVLLPEHLLHYSNNTVYYTF